MYLSFNQVRFWSVGCVGLDLRVQKKRRPKQRRSILGAAVHLALQNANPFPWFGKLKKMQRRTNLDITSLEGALHCLSSSKRFPAIAHPFDTKSSKIAILLAFWKIPQDKIFTNI